MKKIFLLLIFVCFSASSQFIKLQNTKYFVVYDTLDIGPRYAKYVIDFNTYSVGYARKSITLDTRLKRKSQANAFDFAKNNVYDRGHLAPVIDFEYNIALLKEVNKYSNIAPQHENLNRGSWRNLERYIHDRYLLEQKNIIVWTGIIPGYRLLGKLKVPLFFWKMIEIDGVFYAWKFPNTQLLNQNFSFYETDPLALQQLIQNYGFENFY